MTIDERARKMHDDSGCECSLAGREEHSQWFADQLRAVREEVLQQLMSKTELYRNGLLRAAEIVEEKCYEVEKMGQREHLVYLIRKEAGTACEQNVDNS